jgi:hypothetical protein
VGRRAILRRDRTPWGKIHSMIVSSHRLNDIPNIQNKKVKFELEKHMSIKKKRKKKKEKRKRKPLLLITRQMLKRQKKMKKTLRMAKKRRSQRQRLKSSITPLV